MTTRPDIAALEQHPSHWLGKALARKEFARQCDGQPGDEALEHHRKAAEYERKAEECAKRERGK